MPRLKHEVTRYEEKPGVALHQWEFTPEHVGTIVWRKGRKFKIVYVAPSGWAMATSWREDGTGLQKSHWILFTRFKWVNEKASEA